jgi:DNA-nicking Smr family endonuclease
MAKDVDLFERAMAGAGVRPLGPRRKPKGASTPDFPLASGGEGRKGRNDGPRPLSRPLLLAGAKGPRAAEASPDLALDDASFDRDILRALGRGKLVPQASLDLHGMTLAAAQRAVNGFLERTTSQDLRLVLVVTGKGIRLEGGRVFGGRIRSEFLGWINRADNRARVRAVRPAHPRHGGSGAFYVLLRRRSSASSRSLR